MKISIVTIVRNEQKFISATLNSILKQSHSNWECLIVDGGSTDGTLQIVASFCEQDARFTLIAQLSKGISAAFNEGAAVAKGLYLIFMNGGDEFASDIALDSMVQAGHIHPNKFIAAKAEYISEAGERTGKLIPPGPATFLDLEHYCSICHQAVLVPRSAHIELGGYSPAMRNAMDYEFWLRAYSRGWETNSMPNTVAFHRLGGVSQTFTNRGRMESVLAKFLHLKMRRASIVRDIVKLGYAIFTSLLSK